MNYFSVPADYKKTTIDRYCELNQKYKNSSVIETYGNITIDNIIGSGRVTSELPQIDLLDLKEYVEYSREKGIEFNYTLNATHLNKREFSSEGIESIISFLGEIHNIGIRNLTIAMPSLYEIVKKSGYNFKIKMSTLCQIVNVNKAMFYKEIGAERIVIDESINRDFKTIRDITKEFGDKVEIIVNPICLTDCIYRMFHYNQISGDSVTECTTAAVDYYEHRCVLQRHMSIFNMLKIAFVRPEDIPLYVKSGITHFKLQGRHLVMKGDPVKTVEMYFKQNFDGDIMNLIYMFAPLNNFKIYLDNKKLEGFIKPFYEVDNFCDKNCKKCNYCHSFSKKVINYKQAEEIVNLSREFYEQYDSFNQIIDNVIQKKKSMQQRNNLDNVGFEF